MRPLRLEIEGFTSFREKAVLDFEGLDLFAVTGPTGAGKSSLIDALVFALYGQVPRVGKEYRQLLSHGAERASVRLDFAVGKERYRVVRTIRAAGAAPTRLERVRPGSPEKTTSLADRVSEIEAHVERIVGLDYDAFIRSVVLPQGQFDAFLKGEARERRKILITLLDLHVYLDMHEAANRRAAEARREAEFISGQLGTDFAGATPLGLEALRNEQAEAEASRAAVETALEGLREAHEAALRVLEAGREAGSRAREALEAGRALARAEAAPAELRERSAALAREKDKVEGLLDTLVFDAFRQAVLLGARPTAVRLADLGPRRDKAAAASKGMPDTQQAARRKAKTTLEAVPLAEKAVGAARAAALAARAEREALHRAHAAHELRRTLKPGDPCPVCTQAVVLLPPAVAPALDRADRELRAAEKALDAAQGALTQAKVGAEQAKGELARLEAESTKAKELLDAADREIGEARAALQEAGFSGKVEGDSGALARAIEAELKALEAARTGRGKVEAERARLSTEIAGAQAGLAAAEAQIAFAGERVREATEKERATREEHEASERAFRDLIVRRGLKLDGLRTGSTGSGSRNEPGSGRDESGRDIGRDIINSLLGAAQKDLAAHAATAARLAAEAGEMERRMARAAELNEKKKVRDAEAALASSLAQSLRADQFLAYVLEEALSLLAADGSRHLKQLSQGRYSLLCEDQEFYVVDHWNADAKRSVKTLSGGETFLASLGLALALAESLASLSAEDRAGEALESLFLDEGFGTLDPETLGQVVQAIEALQGGERMVGVITHLPELAEQMPARVLVGRSDRGATLTLG